MKVIGVVTSPRCGKVTQALLDDIVQSDNIMDTIYDIGYTGKVSNSEALLLASMWGAHKEGAEVELIYPGDNIPDFDGVVLSTPVYFGDRSSTLHRFIREVYLKEKAVGVVSAGAKRNGGQETTNIYALYDCLVQGALITGNGPPTAQYGGTGWAGNKTSIVNDDFGIKTSYGTGIQVARLAKVVTAKESERRPKVTFVVVTKDHMDMSFTDMWFKNFDVEIVDITKFNIRKCIACPVCPNGDLTKDYKCIIKNDDMDEVRKPMVRGDCIIFVSGTDDTEFQEFIERTRFIRRDHFELSERVYSSISVTSSITDILPLRIMTNLLRQNMFGLPFLKEFKKTFSIPFRGYAPMIEKFTRKSITMREKTGIDNEYTAVGYEDAKIDEKAYRD